MEVAGMLHTLFTYSLGKNPWWPLNKAQNSLDMMQEEESLLLLGTEH
jgi:hypothetical protein